MYITVPSACEVSESFKLMTGSMAIGRLNHIAVYGVALIDDFVMFRGVAL
jgi:hypothetical protein